VKGAYDPYNQYAYWLYSDGSLGSNFEYNQVLMYNSRTKAFFPLEIDVPSVADIHGISFIEDVVGISDPAIKYTCSYHVTPTTKHIFFADQVRDTQDYTDWRVFADEVSLTAADAKDYSSYFITGYNLDGDTMKYFQPNYIMFFLDQDGDDDTSSCFVQGIFDFTTSGNSGRWSSKQQMFNSGLTLRNTNVRRMKIRGRGRALQFKVSSESGKPFSLVGWSTWKTMSSEL
jgi:hypothetical protein